VIVSFCFIDVTRIRIPAPFWKSGEPPRNRSLYLKKVDMAAREPLLFKGDDFGRTDVEVADY